MNKKWGFVFLVLLVAILVRQSMIINNMTQLRDQMNHVDMSLGTLSSRLSGVDSDLRELVKQERILQTMSFEYEEITKVGDVTPVKVFCTLSKVGLNSDVMMHYRPEEGGDWKAVSLERTSDGAYSGQFEVGYDADLETKLVIETDGIIETVSGYDLDLYSSSLPAYDWDMNFQEISGDGNLTYDVFLGIWGEEDRVRVTKAFVEAFYKGDRVDAFDIMTEDNKEIMHDDFTHWWTDRHVSFESSETVMGFSEIELVMTVEDSIGRVFEHRYSH